MQISYHFQSIDIRLAEKAESTERKPSNAVRFLSALCMIFSRRNCIFHRRVCGSIESHIKLCVTLFFASHSLTFFTHSLLLWLFFSSLCGQGDLRRRARFIGKKNHLQRPSRRPFDVICDPSKTSFSFSLPFTLNHLLNFSHLSPNDNFSVFFFRFRSRFFRGQRKISQFCRSTGTYNLSTAP